MATLKYYDETLEEWVPIIAGVDGEDGLDGKDGKDVNLDDIQQIIDGEMSEIENLLTDLIGGN